MTTQSPSTAPRHGVRMLIAALVAGLALAVAHFGWVDDISRDYTETTLKRALVAFGIARGLNGVISVAQGTEVAIQPAGIGVNFTPGEILDPINDLIERFSWVMLTASTSLGVQRIAIEITRSSGFTIALAVALLGVLAVLWWHAHFPAWLRRALFAGTAALLVLRFAIPAVAIGSEALYTWFLADTYEQSAQKLEETTGSIAQINRSTAQQATQPPADSLFESAKRLYESAAASIDIQSRIDQYKQAAAEVTEYAVNLIVVFVVQTVLFPMLFLWGILKVLKWVLLLRLEAA